jgi:hypothetical protein
LFVNAHLERSYLFVLSSIREWVEAYPRPGSVPGMKKPGVIRGDTGFWTLTRSHVPNVTLNRDASRVHGCLSTQPSRYSRNSVWPKSAARTWVAWKT